MIERAPRSGVVAIGAALVVLLVLAAVAWVVVTRSRAEHTRQERATAAARQEASRELIQCTSARAELEARVREHEDGRTVMRRDVYAARVVGVEGDRSTHVGDACRIELEWAPRAERCRAMVTCGESWLYGGIGQGYFDCTSGEDDVVAGTDAEPSAADGDPRLVLRRADDRLELSDDAPPRTITIAIGAREAGSTVGGGVPDRVIWGGIPDRADVSRR